MLGWLRYCKYTIVIETTKDNTFFCHDLLNINVAFVFVFKTTAISRKILDLGPYKTLNDLQQSEKKYSGPWVSAVRAKRAFSTPWKLGLRTKNLKKT